MAEDPEFAKLTRMIQTKTLRNIPLIWYKVFHNYETNPTAEKILMRAKQKQPHITLTFRNLVSNLRPEDVAEMLEISKRRAKEYVKVFKTIYGEIATKHNHPFLTICSHPL